MIAAISFLAFQRSVQARDALKTGQTVRASRLVARPRRLILVFGVFLSRPVLGRPPFPAETMTQLWSM